MKKILLSLVLFMGLCTYQAKAQWIVADPTNLIQNIVSAVQSVKSVSNMVQNVQEVKKVYDQGKEYYDALKSVNNLIKDARKVKKTIEMISEITDIYTNGFTRMLNDPNFTPAELEAISMGYTKLLEEGGALVTELKDVVTGGNGLSLSDKERMDVIDQVYEKMLEYRNLTKYYTKKSISVSFIRSQESGDMERVRALYGDPSERYW